MALSARQHAFFLIALAQRPKQAEALFPYVTKERQLAYEQMYHELKSSRPDDLQRVARGELRKLAQEQISHYLNEVHDDWLADMLATEAPHVVATILRYLPAERVNQILDLLPKDLLESLPSLSDTFAIPQTLVNHLRHKFEGLFVQTESLTKGRKLSWNAICFMRAAQVENVFLEAGYREIALGLSAVPPHVQLTVLSRLLPSDRDCVERYLTMAQDVGEQRVKRAQVHLISREVDPANPRRLVRELGALIFAKCVLPGDIERLQPLFRKMSKIEGAALNDLLKEMMPKNTEMTVRVYREDLLDAAANVLNTEAARLAP